MCPLVVVADDPAGVAAAGCSARRDAAVATIAKDVVAGEQVRDGVAARDDVVAVAGPAAPGYQHAGRWERMMIWVWTLRR